jgi:tetratricopeptide (TPR) repeat protein
MEPKHVARYWRLRSHLAELRNQYEAALPCIDRALELQPSDPGSLTRKARILQRLRRHDEAKDLYRRVAEINEMRQELFKLAKSVQNQPATVDQCERISEVCENLGKSNQADAWRAFGEALRNTIPNPNAPHPRRKAHTESHALDRTP